MSSYVGFCGPAISKATQWGSGDVIGHLLRETPFGWVQAGQHLSSSPAFAREDIRSHFDRRDDPDDADTYEWIGQQTDTDALMEKYPPAQFLDAGGKP